MDRAARVLALVGKMVVGEGGPVAGKRRLRNIWKHLPFRPKYRKNKGPVRWVRSKGRRSGAVTGTHGSCLRSVATLRAGLCPGWLCCAAQQCVNSVQALPWAHGPANRQMSVVLRVLPVVVTPLAQLWRRPARWGHRRRGGSWLGIEVGENLVDDVLVFDTGDAAHCPSTVRTGLDIDTKHPLAP